MIEPLVSVVITNYNNLKYIKECFNSLEKLTYKNFEIIFVDNNSSDDSVVFVRNNYPNVKVFKNRKDLGFTGANNIGASHAKGEYIVLLNVDTTVDKNWLSELVKVAQSSEDIGIVGSKMYYHDDKKTIDFAGSIFDKYGNVYHIGLKKFDTELFNIQTKTFYICGASLMFRRDVYNRIDLFDPIYYMYGEDVDFCWRTWISGYNVVYAPKSIIYHKIPRIRKKVILNKYFSERNKLRTVLKNYEFQTLIKILPSFFYQRIRFINKARKENLVISSRTLILIFFKVILWNILHINSLINNRIKIQRNRKRNDQFLFKLMKELREFLKK